MEVLVCQRPSTDNMEWALSCFVLCMLAAAGLAVPLESATEDIPALRKDLEQTLITGVAGPVLREISEVLNLPEMLISGGHETWVEKNQEKGFLFCLACSTAVDVLLGQVEDGMTMDRLFNLTANICVTLQISNENFCYSMMEVAKPQISWVLENTEGLNGKDVCGMVFVMNDCVSKNPARVWEVTLSDVPKPQLVEPVIPVDATTLTVLHLADTHMDPDYTPGSNAVCGEKFLCCRSDSGEPAKPEDAAGYWGDYRYCDAPRWSLEAIHGHIRDTHPNISFILWTGDLVPHNVWSTSREGVLAIIREVIQMIKDYFPNTPVFPAIGNHESHPANTFPQPYIDNEFDPSWMYDEIAVLWETWLPADVAHDVLHAAYYVVDVFPDLRLVSINTNYCYAFNWWLLHDSVDPGAILSWLAGQLQRAEDDGVKVYLVGHQASGHDDCSYTWSHEFNKIVARYEGVIVGIFYGHTHKDHFQIFFDPEEPERPTQIGYVAQSQTPYHLLNPGYKIYTVDGGYPGCSYTVLDHENWYMDLAKANAENATNFQLLYRAKEAYNMTDLSPASHLNLVKAMAPKGSPTFDLFFKHYIKNAKPYMEEGCDEDCKYKILCRLLVSDTTDRSRCDMVKP